MVEGEPKKNLGPDYMQICLKPSGGKKARKSEDLNLREREGIESEKVTEDIGRKKERVRNTATARCGNAEWRRLCGKANGAEGTRRVFPIT